MTNNKAWQRSRILIIDDDRDIWNSYKKILDPEQPEPDSATSQLHLLLGQDDGPTPEEAEFHLDFASQGQDGFQLVADSLEERPFAMAFIDIRMPPGWDGMETAAQIRRIDADIELVIVSAYSDRTMRDIVWAVGAPDKLLFLRKPFDPEEIQQMARSLTSKWRLTREERSQRTARELVEAQLQQAQKMESLGTLAGGIAHDFNNILSAIMGYTDLALLRSRESDAVLNDLRQVRQATERASDLVRQILTFSRREPSQKVPMRLGLVVKEAAKLIRATIPSTIHLRQDIDAQTTVLADPTKIHQVMMNLCTNAAHAMAESGGTLEITLGETELTQGAMPASDTDLPPGHYAVLSVRDTGHGISQEHQKRIFDPYFTTKEKGKGTGLGLAVVHGIVRDHLGGITVSSEVDHGTCFTIYLPTTNGTAAVAEAGIKEIVRAKAGERIMVVDDERILADLAGQCLVEAGYSVDVFDSSPAAWQAFSQHPELWDLLLTDQTMPGLTGDQLAIKALSLRPELPVILCSGYTQLAGDGRLASQGIRTFLQKPINVETLLRTVGDALAAAG